MPSVSVAAVAKALNVTTRRVQQLIDEGMPREARGKYDLGKCMLWYIRFLQEALTKKTPVNDTAEAQDLKKERAGLTKAQKEMAELELAEKRADLISVNDAAAIWEGAIARARARLLSAVNKHAGKILGIKTPAQARIKLEEIAYEALNELVGVADDIPEEDYGSERTGGNKPKGRVKKGAVEA